MPFDFSGDFPHFRKLRIIDDPKDGIAKSMRSTGELVINKRFFLALKKTHQFFVLCHEEGHILYNTRDEMLADEHASKRYLAAGGSIRESVKALSEHLKNNNPAHLARAWAQYQRALKYDWETNRNKKAFRAHYETPEEIIKKMKL